MKAEVEKTINGQILKAVTLKKLVTGHKNTQDKKTHQKIL